MPDAIRKFREETIKMVTEAIDRFGCIACKSSDLRAYAKDKKVLPAKFFAVEKLRKAGYLYEPFEDGTVILVIQPKKEPKIPLALQSRYPPKAKTSSV